MLRYSSTSTSQSCLTASPRITSALTSQRCDNASLKQEGSSYSASLRERHHLLPPGGGRVHPQPGSHRARCCGPLHPPRVVQDRSCYPRGQWLVAPRAWRRGGCEFGESGSWSRLRNGSASFRTTMVCIFAIGSCLLPLSLSSHVLQPHTQHYLHTTTKTSNESVLISLPPPLWPGRKGTFLSLHVLPHARCTDSPKILPRLIQHGKDCCSSSILETRPWVGSGSVGSSLVRHRPA